MTKVLTIGSATMDVFVECDDANIVSVCSKTKNSDFMSYPYGSKIDITTFSSNVGGGGVNTACNFANLGFDTSAIFKIGEDIYSEGILDAFKNKNVNLANIIQNKEASTGFSIILVSFQGDRTVLAHRGANAQIMESEINFKAIEDADLISAHIVVMNKEEATMATGIQVRPDTKTEKFSHELIHRDVKKMLTTMKVMDYQIVVITDGGKGAYAYDGQKFYFCPVFPSPVISTLGAGDAFASTFCAALERTKLNVGLSLMYASVNSSSVVSEFGATEGLATFEQIEEKLKNNPDYTYLEG